MQISIGVFWIAFGTVGTVIADYFRYFLLLGGNYLEILINRLKDEKFIIDSLTAENVPTKYMGIFKWKDGPLRRIDIRFIPYESYYPAMLYFTGGKDFNRKMRQVAVNNNFTLNEYGLFDENGKMIKVNSEKDIFDELGMEYLTPDKRI